MSLDPLDREVPPHSTGTKIDDVIMDIVVLFQMSEDGNKVAKTALVDIEAIVSTWLSDAKRNQEA